MNKLETVCQTAITNSGLPIYMEEKDKSSILQLYESVMTRLSRADVKGVKDVHPEIKEVTLVGIVCDIVLLTKCPQLVTLVKYLPILHNYLDLRDEDDRKEEHDDSLLTRDICGKTMARKKSLSRPMRIQTGTSFHCSICGKKLSTKQRLTNHVRTHTGEKPFQCTVCGRRFIEKGNLAKHNKDVDCLSNKKKAERKTEKKFTGKRH